MYTLNVGSLNFPNKAVAERSGIQLDPWPGGHVGA